MNTDCPVKSCDPCDDRKCGWQVYLIFVIVAILVIFLVYTLVNYPNANSRGGYCHIDDNCQEDLKCVNNRCAYPPNDGKTYINTRCYTNYECPNNSYCSSLEMCLIGSGSEIGQPCIFSQECQLNNYCNAQGYCQEGHLQYVYENQTGVIFNNNGPNGSKIFVNYLDNQIFLQLYENPEVLTVYDYTQQSICFNDSKWSINTEGVAILAENGNQIALQYENDSYFMIDTLGRRAYQYKDITQNNKLIFLLPEEAQNDLQIFEVKFQQCI